MKKIIMFFALVSAIILINFLGSILIIGGKLGDISWILEAIFYIIFFCTAAYFIAKPIIKLKDTKFININQIINSNNYNSREAEMLADLLINSKTLSNEEKNTLSRVNHTSSLKGYLNNHIEKAKKDVDTIIITSSSKVFLATSISQNPLIDSLIILSVNFSMITNIINTFGYRPPLIYIVKLYANVIINAAIAATAETLDISEITGQLIGSVTQGTAAGLFTLRAGYLAKEYYFNACIIDVEKEKKSAYNFAKENLRNFFALKI